MKLKFHTGNTITIITKKLPVPQYQKIIWFSEHWVDWQSTKLSGVESGNRGINFTISTIHLLEQTMQKVLIFLNR